MKHGLCRLVQSAASIHLAVRPDVIKAWREVMMSSIFYVNPKIREHGTNCLSVFVSEYFKSDESLFEEILAKIRDQKEEMRCGSFEALEVYPLNAISETNRITFINMMINYIASRNPRDQLMTEARAASIKTLTSFVIRLLTTRRKKLPLSSPLDVMTLKPQVIQIYKDCLVPGTRDYTTGTKG